MSNIVIRHEQCSDYICSIAYDYHDFSQLTAHVWEHLVLNARVDYKLTLKEKILELGGSIKAETTLSLTSFFVKIPASTEGKRLLEMFCNIVRYPLFDDEMILRTYKEVAIEEMLRRDDPLIHSIEALRAKVYDDYDHATFHSGELVNDIRHFSKKMSTEDVFIALAGDFDPDSLKNVVHYQPGRQIPEPLTLNVTRNYPMSSGSTTYISRQTLLEYISIIFLPTQTMDIFLSFLNFLIFGVDSPFIKKLKSNGYIYNYRNGVNYYRPVGIEFMTAVLPERSMEVLGMWGNFQSSAETLFLEDYPVAIFERFISMLRLEWRHLEKRIKWTAESFILYRTIVDPDYFRKAVDGSGFLGKIPQIIKNSAAHTVLVGPKCNYHEL